MQPWLDFDARETGCRRCSRPLEGADVRIWACRERTRRLEFDGATGPGVVRYGEVSRAYPVCAGCYAALERGSGMGSPALSRLLVLLGVVAGLWLVGGPAVHRWAPGFIAAFYRNGALGR